MESRNKLLKSLRLQPLLAKIAVGYMAKIVVISGIAYVGICEWKETKAREMEVRMINRKKHEINDIYVKMLRLSFFCETFMEWSEQDFLLFQKRKQPAGKTLPSRLFLLDKTEKTTHFRHFFKKKALHNCIICAVRLCGV